MKRTRIALLGIFGVQNIGNECTLQAVAYNVQQRLPAADVYSICYEPEDTIRRHGLKAVPISSRHSHDVATSRGGPRPRRGTIARAFRMAFLRAPGELLEWVRAVKVLKDTDMVAMTGTGMLTDYSTSAFGYPYDIWKWATAAKLARCKVRFIGIGVGPIYERLSRSFIRSALGTADYRSFRDELSKIRLRTIGFDTAADPVFPDLAFSLPPCLFDEPQPQVRRATTIGVGVINFFDKHAAGEKNRESTYKTYLSKMCDFVQRLVELGYRVRILQGDMRYDGSVRRDLRSRLEQRGTRYEQCGIIDEDVNTVQELLAQIVATDLVVSPRFHNLILALMMGRPVAAISYDPKSDVLLEGFGLAKYRQTLDDFDVDTLVEHVLELDRRRDALEPVLRRKTQEYRSRLDAQYQVLLRGL